ncbi:TIGR02996 domain-containing protein [Limnoglobus roseus]|uniref:TIGR02996 domain-containing protein n=1 Tax=Limnoglobus roseus TaxID=2598579 RepID=A0A5C1A212_9BACT|nr:TIGR02996 domain-containing protein [Limnoglobus roseus]QEL13151.1 TIGR02996 domain-containing protein [Limnoglobus roseus]
MTEREALYAAVRAEPEADAPRLVYADWLEEHPRGDADTARATFIRLEIEAENLPADSPDRGRVELAAAKLFNHFGEAWNHELPTWDEWYDSTLVYRRGFPDELRTVFRKLVYSGGKLFEEAPIRALSVRTGRGQLLPWRDTLLQSVGGQLPNLSRLRSLWVGPGLGLNGTGDGVRRTFQMAATYPSLENLERLSFAGNGVDDDSVLLLDRSLRDAVFLGPLEELDLSDNNIRAAGATTLSVVPSLSRVRRLILSGNPLTDYARKMLRNHFGERVVL